MGLFLHMVVDCAVGFNGLDFQSTATSKLIHRPAGACLIRIGSFLFLIFGYAENVGVSVYVAVDVGVGSSVGVCVGVGVGDGVGVGVGVSVGVGFEIGVGVEIVDIPSWQCLLSSPQM